MAGIIGYTNIELGSKIRVRTVDMNNSKPVNPPVWGLVWSMDG